MFEPAEDRLADDSLDMREGAIGQQRLPAA
jgi:hypothetical protein